MSALFNSKSNSQHSANAYADQQALERLKPIGWASVQSMCRELLRTPDGERFVLPQPSPEQLVQLGDEPLRAFERLLAVNQVLLLQRYCEMALPWIMEDASASIQLDQSLAQIYTHANTLAQKAHAAVEQREHAHSDREPFFKRLFGRGKVSDVIGEAVTLLQKAQLHYEYQKDRMRADTLEIVLVLIATAQDLTRQWGKQRVVLTTTIREAIELAHSEVLALEQTIATSTVIDDLPEEYLARVAQALNNETPEQAHTEALQALSRALVEAEETDQPVTARQLYAHIQATTTPSIELIVPSLQATSEMVATPLGIDAAHLWRRLIEHLRSTAFAQTPTVSFTKTIEREGKSYLFQVLPAGQAPIFAGDSQEARVAYFHTDGPATRVGLIHIQTNFPLDIVLPVKELACALTQAAAEANPFILPEFIDRYMPRTSAIEKILPESFDNHNDLAADEIITSIIKKEI